MNGELLYFNPDPQIPDADLLGFGDLVYSNGRTEYLSGDEELAASLPRPPPGVTPQGSIGMGPPAPPEQAPFQPVTIEGAMGPVQVDLKDPENPIKPIGFESVPAIDPSARPDIQPVPGSEQYSGDAFRPAGSLPGLGAASPNPIPGLQSQGQEQQSPIQPVTIQGSQGPVQIDMRDPENPIKPVGADGLQLVGREGALPTDVAQRQLSQLDAMQQQTIRATEQARADEARIMNDATLKAMAQNEANRIAQEQQVAEQQAKAERLDRERQMVAEMEIDRSLSGAVGVVGGVMSIIGAALMASTGSDTGLRMIENTIDRSIREQVRRRDTQLNLLSERLGSTQQAIKMGKAEMYRLGAEKAELLMQKTKADVYEAQSPAIIQGLRQKSLENLQEAERISLGKPIEKAAAPPKPPDPAALQKYGELRRERDASTNLVERVEQQLGLRWSPGQGGKEGQYQNRDEVLKRGIQGVGELEQWVPDFVYRTWGDQEALQIRGAAEALAYAQIRQMQPTGPISNADIQAAVRAGSLQTEEGLLRGLERMRHGEEEQMRNDAAQYGPDVVGTYESRWRASGGQPAREPAPARPASIGDLPAERQRRQNLAPTSTAQDPTTSTELDKMTPEQRMAALNESLATVSQEKSLPPEGIAILMAQAGHETNDGKNMPTNNFFGMKSTQRNRNRGAGMTNLMTTEGAGSNAKRVAQNFATFDSAADAAMDMLSLLERKYPRALEALQVGDPDAYVAALKDGGYFTGNEGGYLQGILRRL